MVAVTSVVRASSAAKAITGIIAKKTNSKITPCKYPRQPHGNVQSILLEDTRINKVLRPAREAIAEIASGDMLPTRIG
jgi:hypothetical protein